MVFWWIRLFWWCTAHQNKVCKTKFALFWQRGLFPDSSLYLRPSHSSLDNVIVTVWYYCTVFAYSTRLYSPAVCCRIHICGIVVLITQLIIADPISQDSYPCTTSFFLHCNWQLLKFLMANPSTKLICQKKRYHQKSGGYQLLTECGIWLSQPSCDVTWKVWFSACKVDICRVL